MGHQVRIRLLGPVTVVALLSALPATSLADQHETCVVVGDKVTSRSQARVGEPVAVRLTLRADCPESPDHAVDVVLAIDTSNSMFRTGMIEGAKQAAHTFVNEIDLSVHRVALVTFSTTAHLDLAFSHDAAELGEAIDRVTVPQGQTNIADAIDIAFAEISGNARQQSTHALVLLSDGFPNRPNPDPGAAALASADTAKLAGVRIVTVGLGRVVDLHETLLRQLASCEDDYYYSPTAEGLEDLYTEIAAAVARTTVREVVITDTLSADVVFATGSAVPAATVRGPQLQWTMTSLPQSGSAWTYQVLPVRPGVYPVNDYAEASYIDIDAVRKKFFFPIPSISVDPPGPVPPSETPRPGTTPAPECVCQAIRNRVPSVVVAAALANPDRYQGWQELLDPGKPASPANPPRECLSLRSNSSPYHPLYNSVVWRAGCP